MIYRFTTNLNWFINHMKTYPKYSSAIIYNWIHFKRSRVLIQWWWKCHVFESFWGHQKFSDIKGLGISVDYLDSTGIGTYNNHILLTIICVQEFRWRIGHFPLQNAVLRFCCTTSSETFSHNHWYWEITFWIKRFFISLYRDWATKYSLCLNLNSVRYHRRRLRNYKFHPGFRII